MSRKVSVTWDVPNDFEFPRVYDWYKCQNCAFFFDDDSGCGFGGTCILCGVYDSAIEKGHEPPFCPLHDKNTAEVANDYIT